VSCSSQVYDGVVCGWKTIDVGVYQQGVVEAEQRIVERRLVKTDIDPWSAEHGSQVGHGQLDPGRHRVPDPSLLTTPGHGLRQRVTEENTDTDTLFGFLRQEAGQIGPVVGKEEPGVDEHVHALLRGFEKFVPKSGRNRSTVGIEVHDL